MFFIGGTHGKIAPLFFYKNMTLPELAGGNLEFLKVCRNVLPTLSKDRHFSCPKRESQKQEITMKIQKLKFLLAFGGGLWLFFFFLSVPVRAQQGVTFESVQIDLWPEYDRPDMLVVYRFVLAADAQLPTELSLRIPAAAGTPNAASDQ